MGYHRWWWKSYSWPRVHDGDLQWLRIDTKWWWDEIPTYEDGSRPSKFDRSLTWKVFNPNLFSKWTFESGRKLSQRGRVQAQKWGERSTDLSHFKVRQELFTFAKSPFSLGSWQIGLSCPLFLGANSQSAQYYSALCAVWKVKTVKSVANSS